MKKNILNVHAWDYVIDDLESVIINGRYTEINFIWQLEWELWLTQNTVDHINSNNIKVNVITCVINDAWLRKHVIDRGIRSELVTTETWPSFWFMRSHLILDSHGNSHYQNINTRTPDFKYPFLTFNNRVKTHRTMLVDLLCKHGYMDKGIITYHQQSSNGQLEWRHYSGEPITIDDDYTVHNVPHSFNEKFIQSFLHIPTESTLDTAIISEKTANPILCKLPFLTLGPKNYHRDLANMGFEPYTEIFDYSFDKESNLEKRIEKLLINVQFVIDNQHRLNELYAVIEPKLERNRRRALKYVESYKLLPEMIKRRFNDYEKGLPITSSWDTELQQIGMYFKDRTLPAPVHVTAIFKCVYDYWYNFSFDKVIQDIREKNPSSVVILGENEWQLWFTEEFIQLINERNIKLTLTTASTQTEWTETDVEKYNIKNYHIEYWPTFWINHSENRLDAADFSYKHYQPPQSFSHPFICLMNRGHLHRCATIDQLAKHGLLDKGVVTWHDIHNEGDEYDFKHYDRSVRKLDDKFDAELSSFIIPNEYHESLFDFVTESAWQTVIISEKTVKPLLLKKPFAVLGARHYNKFLVELGFELYDEFIDYSYDNIEDTLERSAAYVMNIKSISEIQDLAGAYKTLYPKIMHNYHRALAIKNDFNLFPPEVKKILDQTPENEMLISHEYQRKYMNLKKRMSQ